MVLRKAILVAVAVVVLLLLRPWPSIADDMSDMAKWCATQATAPSSVVICSDPELRRMAVVRNKIFADARAHLSDDEMKDLTAEQNDWIHEYTAACGVSVNGPTVAFPISQQIIDCYKKASRERIAELIRDLREIIPNYQEPMVSGSASSMPNLTFEGKTTFQVVGVPSNDVLDIRKQAGESQIVGAIPPNGTGIVYEGDATDDGSWVLISYQNTTGWVASRYLRVTAICGRDITAPPGSNVLIGHWNRANGTALCAGLVAANTRATNAEYVYGKGVSIRLSGEFDGGTYTLQDRDGSKYTFEPSGSATFVGGSGQMSGEFFARFRGAAGTSSSPPPPQPHESEGSPSEPTPTPSPPRTDELLGALTNVRHTIEQRLSAIHTKDLRTQAEELLPKLAAANRNTSVWELERLSRSGEELITRFNEADEFERVSAIATKQIARIEEELKDVVSDAPYLGQIQRAIDSLQKSQQLGNLSQLQNELANLNRLHEFYKLQIERDRFGRM